MLKDIRPVSLPQMQFLSCPDKEVGYGGSAFCGKTLMLVQDAIRQVDHPRYKGILFRRKRKELKEMIEYADAIYLPSGSSKKGSWETGVVYTFPQGSSIELNSIEHEDDWQDYHGGNYCYYGFDELVTFAMAQYTNLMTWLRAVEEGLTPYVRWTSNPWPAAGGDGIEWIMERFGIPDGVPVKRPIRTMLPGGLSRMFIPATYRDNKAVPPKAIEEWKQTLKQNLDPDKYTAYLEGVWGVAPGRFFKRFSKAIHVIEPEEMNEMLADGVSEAACGLDHGSDEPTCCLKGSRRLDDIVCIEDEYYVPDRPIVYHAPRLKEFIKQGNYDLPVKADPSMWKVGEKKVEYSDRFISEEYIQRDVYLTPAINNQAQGYRAIKDGLFFDEEIEGLESPMLYISSKCKNLIRELMTAQADPNDPDNRILEDGKYHAIATLRYLMMHLARPRRTKEEKREQNIVRKIREKKRKDKMRRAGLYA